MNFEPNLDDSRGELAVMDKTGDTKVMWNRDSAAEVGIARDAFNKLKAEGYTAYSVKKNGEQNEVIREFDPKAEKLIMVPAMVGG